nr:MAG TPA: hypothetical protein [Bacteriophage sp.]
MYRFAECDIIGLPFFLIGGGSFPWSGQPPYLFCSLIITLIIVLVNTKISEKIKTFLVAF